MNTEPNTQITPEEEFMAFVATLPTPKWRLLNKGEKFQPGDQFFNLHPDCIYWDFIPSAWEGTDCSGDDLERRPMTPAEVNAEELLELAQIGLQLMDEAADHGENLASAAQKYREAYCTVMDKIDP